MVQQPRQIYASTADRRHGRRWTRRHRAWSYWLPAAIVSIAALEAFRSLA